MLEWKWWKKSHIKCESSQEIYEGKWKFRKYTNHTKVY
jgi:hypothetical protein